MCLARELRLLACSAACASAGQQGTCRSGAPASPITPTRALQTRTSPGQQRTAARWSCTRRARVSTRQTSAGRHVGFLPARLKMRAGARGVAAGRALRAWAALAPERSPALPMARRSRPSRSTGTPNEPGVVPTATALPLWNTMAFFRVQPGRSFHSIQVGGPPRPASLRRTGASPTPAVPLGPGLFAHPRSATACRPPPLPNPTLAGGVCPGSAAHEHPGVVPLGRAARRRGAGHAQPAAAAGGGGHPGPLPALLRWDARGGRGRGACGREGSQVWLCCARTQQQWRHLPGSILA